MRTTRRRLLSCLSMLGLLWACSNDPLAPFEPEVNNATDSFQLQATGLRDVSTTVHYTWRNTGTVANVNHSTTTSEGVARLVVRSADGTQLYDSTLSPSLNEPTASGTSGDWTIELTLAGYSGTLNFRLQKP